MQAYPIKYLIIVIVSFLTLNLKAQTEDLCKKSTEGKDFWFGFMENRWGWDSNWIRISPHYVEITIATRFETDFSLELGTMNQVISAGTIPANSSQRIRLDWTTVEPIGSENIENMGLHLITDNPVSLYAYNFDSFSSDVALIYPTNTIGQEYYAIAYEPTQDLRDSVPSGGGKNSQFLIVATEDSTNVTINPSKVTDQLRPANVPFVVNLNRGEVYQVQSENTPDAPDQGDLTGSHIVSDKPIAFFSGAWAASVPSTSCCWDHLYEQIPPIEYWGSDFVTAPILTKPEDTYRVMASEDNTNITISALNRTVNLNAGEFYEYELANRASRITGTKPFMLMQYSQSGSENIIPGEIPNGDPFTVAMFPINNFVLEATYEVYASPVIQEYYVNIITPKDNTTNILVDGNNIQNQFIPIPNSDYSYAQIRLFRPGQHRIESLDQYDGFIAYQYGFGRLESYGYGIAFDMKYNKNITSQGVLVTDTLIACEGDEIEITVDGSFDFYQWGTNSTEQTIFTTWEGDLPLYSFAEECVEVDSIYIHRLSASIAPIDTLACLGETLNIEAKATGFRQSTFSVYTSDSLENLNLLYSEGFYQAGTEENIFSLALDQTSNYLVSISSASTECTDSSEAILNFIKPTAQFEAFVKQPDPLNNEGPLKDIYVENWSINALHFEWDFGDGNDTVAFQAEHTYEDFGIYPVSLYVEDEYGCKDTIIKDVRLLDIEVFAQNVIYPSGDLEQNRFFAPIIKNKDLLMDYKYVLRIYDRWGAVIFETNNSSAFWNAKLENTNNLVPNGNYIWVLKISEENRFQYIFRGNILVIN